MNTAIKVALVGIGGYGDNFVRGFLETKHREDAKLIAAVDPFPSSCIWLAELEAAEIPIYSTLDQMYADHRPDLVVISSPIQVHCEQTVAALKNGSHVLCEKPLCGTTEQIDQMIAARDRAKRQVAVGYQWSFSQTFQNLKRDIGEGLYGAPKRFATLVCWPRDSRYYGRNRWAGRKYDDAGRAVFDSPLNNACAHYLHIMLYILGGQSDRSAPARDITAELYRANEIENYDTAAVRFKAGENADILYLVTHATADNRGPLFRYEFENGIVTFDSDNGKGVMAQFKDGTTRSYGTPPNGIDKLWTTIDAIRSGATVCCGIEAAAEQTRVMAAVQKNEIVPFPASIVRVKENEGYQALSVDGLENTFADCYREHKLPREIGVSWATSKGASGA